jgi:hypothetical protein
MGTEIVDEMGCYVKRFWGGDDLGVCFSVNVNKDFTQKDFSLFISRLVQYLVVTGEGIRECE